jgi:hypothetical protein
MDVVTVNFVNCMLRAFDEAGHSFVIMSRENSTEFDPQATGVSLMAQAVVSLGNSAFDDISGYDVFWHTAVFRNEIEYLPAEEAKILGAYREWHEHANRLIEILASLDSSGQPIPNLDELKANRRKAQAILTEDNDFFEGEALDHLAEQAIAAFDRGETEEFSEIGR